MATSHELEQRVAELERRVAAAAQPSFSPLGGLKIAPDGAVSYDFDGHIHARGLDLDATGGSGAELAPDHAVRWLDPAGAVMSGIDTSQLSGALRLHGGGLNTFGDPVAEVTVGANSLGRKAITLEVADPAFHSRMLLDEDGRSDFLQLAPAGPSARNWTAGALATSPLLSPPPGSSASYTFTAGLNASGLIVLGGLIQSLNTPFLSWSWNNGPGADQVTIYVGNPTGVACNGYWRGFAIGVF